MRIEENYYIDIDDALRQANLDLRLVPSDISEMNPWFLIMERDLSSLCAQALPKPVRFTFNTSHSIQACVAYQGNLVVMTAGMFNVLCRLASKIVSSGAFVDFKGGIEPTWTPSVENNFQSVTAELSSSPFDWKLDSRAWQKSSERQLLFFYILQTLSRFVVLHELGHLAHNHGARAKSKHCDLVDVDLAQPEPVANGEGVASQAREILADNFAFIRLREIQERELSVKADAEATKILVSKLLPRQQERVSFLLTMAYLYFHMMDRRDWSSIDIFTLTHPPAPFRLKNLFALTLENGIVDLNEEEIGVVLSQCHYGCNALISIVYNNYPLEDMFEAVNAPRFDELFNALFEESPKWRNLE